MPIRADDLDIPKNSLTFSLDKSSPADSSIDPNSGIFNWIIPEDQASGKYPIKVWVTDNGSTDSQNPNLNSFNIFNIVIIGKTQEIRILAKSIRIENNRLVFSWEALSGKRYGINYKNSFIEANWTDAQIVITANETKATYGENLIPNTPHRFYRVILINP